MKNFARILFSGFFLFFISGCGSSDEIVSKDNGNEETFNNTNFTLSLPNDWEVFPSQVLAGKGVVFAARKPSAYGIIETTLAIAEQAIVSNLSVSTFALESLENVRIKSQNYKKISEEEISLDEKPGKLVFYTDRSGTDLSEILFSNLFYIAKGNAYVVTISSSALATQEEKDEILETLKSFRVK